MPTNPDPVAAWIAEARADVLTRLRITKGSTADYLDRALDMLEAARGVKRVPGAVINSGSWYWSSALDAVEDALRKVVEGGR